MSAAAKQTGVETDLDSLIDAGRISRFQIMVITLCAVMVMIDGFDTQVIGMVAPAIAASWHVPPAAFGAVFGIGLFGGLLGALSLGDAGDRFGRKPVLIASILLFAVFSLLTPLASTIQSLTIVRFIAGFGMGGALPGLIAITSEYSPKAVRANVTALMYCGFPVGSILAGVVAAQMAPHFGWQSVFYVGGTLPLVLLPIFVWLVPESIRFSAIKGDRGRVEKILARMHCEGRWNGQVPQVRQQRSPVAGLFKGGRTMGTLFLWAALFLSLLLTVFMVSWLPLLARAAGIDMRSAVLAVSSMNVGAIIGCYTIGKLCNRYGPVKPIAVSYVLGGLSVALIGVMNTSGAELLLASFIAGTFTVGAQMCMIGLSASFYDTSLRATGVGWALGSGRVGAVVGPVIGGILIAAGLPIPLLFVIAGVVSLGAAAAVFSISSAVKRVVPETVSESGGRNASASPNAVLSK